MYKAHAHPKAEGKHSRAVCKPLDRVTSSCSFAHVTDAVELHQLCLTGVVGVPDFSICASCFFFFLYKIFFLSISPHLILSFILLLLIRIIGFWRHDYAHVAWVSLGKLG